MKDTAVVIIDYNNIFKQDDSEDGSNVQSLLTEIINEIKSDYNSVEHIVMRAYGGWYDKNGLTNKGSRIQQKLSAVSVDLFPVPNGNKTISGTLEIADQMFGVDGVWDNTCREKEGLPQLVVNTSNISRIECEKDDNKDVCPVNILKKFTKKRSKICHISNCQNTNAVFYRIEQKMVDSIMVCDILTYGEDEKTKVIYVLSNDVDLFPGIVLCSIKHSEVVLNLKIRTRQAINNNVHLDDSELTRQSRSLTDYSNYLYKFNPNIKISEI
ncbi:MAG: hypothetical protein J6T98_06395 [Salinivirgaceae bacterium]|nr:hypothetical protein [Salinivirgaceae bacterium]